MRGEGCSLTLVRTREDGTGSYQDYFRRQVDYSLIFVAVSFGGMHGDPGFDIQSHMFVLGPIWA